MQKLNSANTDGPGLIPSQNEGGSSADLEELVDICRASGSPEAAAKAERLYRTYKMLADNINPAYAPQLTERLSKSAWPALYQEAVKPLRRSDIVHARKTKRNEAISLAQLEKIDRQVAWVKEYLPEVAGNNADADSQKIAKALREKWNATAPAEERWSTKTALRRLAKAKVGSHAIATV